MRRRSGISIFRLIAAVAAWGALSTGPAMAEALPLDSEDEKSWRFAITPYLFAPANTSGDATVAGVTVPLDVDLSDIFSAEALNGAFSMRGEAWKGDFGLIADLYWVDLGQTLSTSLPTPPGGSANVEVGVEQGWLALLGSYRAIDGRFAESGRRYSVDFGAGARYNKLRQTIDGAIDIGPLPGVQVNLGGTEYWWEPVVTARASSQISDRWTVSLRADLGGFGVNGNNLQTVVVGGFDWRAWETTSVKFGWQFYSIDYSTTLDDGKFAYDVQQHGPWMGLSFRF